MEAAGKLLKNKLCIYRKLGDFIQVMIALKIIILKLLLGYVYCSRKVIF